MPVDKRITELDVLVATDLAVDDLVVVTDVSDPTMHPTGTAKHMVASAFSPSFTSIGASGITVVQGVGTINLDAGSEVRYAQVGKVVTLNALLTMGTGTAGTTNSTITVAVNDAPAANTSLSALAWGDGQAFLSTPGLAYQLAVTLVGGPAPTFAFYRTDGTGDGSNYVGKDPNVGLVEFDTIAFSITYEAV